MRAALLVLLSVVLTFAGGAAGAQSLYLGVQGGYGSLFESDFNEGCILLFCSSDGTAFFHGNTVVGGVVGFETALGIRVEGEYTYRRNGFDYVDWPDTARATTGTVRSRAAMANLYYDLGFGPVRPYVGGGVGVMWIDYEGVSDANGLLFEGERTVMAGQVMAGVGVSPLPSTTVYFDYRMHFTQDSRFNFASTQRVEIAGESLDVEYWGQSVMVGIRQSF